MRSRTRRLRGRTRSDRRRAIAIFVALVVVFQSATLIETATAAPTVPAAPTSPSAAPGNAQATVKWIAPANNGSAITAYVVTPFVGSTAQPARTFNSAATTETVTGLTNTSVYTFKVAA